MSEKVTKLIEDVKTLTVLELSNLVKALEEEFGVSAAAPIAMSSAQSDSGSEKVAEKTEFDVILKNPGANKIKVIKVIKEVTGLGLKEAKEMVDNPPKTIKEKISKDASEELKKQLEELGAEIEVK